MVVAVLNASLCYDCLVCQLAIDLQYSVMLSVKTKRKQHLQLSLLAREVSRVKLAATRQANCNVDSVYRSINTLVHNNIAHTNTTIQLQSFYTGLAVHCHRLHSLGYPGCCVCVQCLVVALVVCFLLGFPYKMLPTTPPTR